jgi:hypothetical protein
LFGGEVAIRHDSALTILRCSKSRRLARELGRSGGHTQARDGLRPGAPRAEGP